MHNLSDGIKDGFALFYIKKGKLCSVLLDKEQSEALDLTLGIVFKKGSARIVSADTEVMKRYLGKDGGAE